MCAVSFDPPPEYGADALAAAIEIEAMLVGNLHARTLPPLELWEQWPDWLPRGAWAKEITWMMWSAAHSVARETVGLGPLPQPGLPDQVAYIFAMSDTAAVEEFARRMRASNS